VTARWTIGVVVAIFLVALLVGNLGVMRITRSLTEIIGLMESVAMMHVEMLDVPQKSPVVEVARIQNAFRMLIHQLLEYKSYMPAPLFQPSPNPLTARSGLDGIQDLQTADSSQSEDPVTNCHPNRPEGWDFIPSSSPASRRGMRPLGRSFYVPPTDLGRLGRRNVAVVVINVRDFRTLLNKYNSSFDAVFAGYISTVHEIVAKAKGNLDCVLGDRVFATFNAHIPCGDPITAATGAAVDLSASLAISQAEKFVCQVGVSCGAMVAGSTGYSRFKTMVALGPPMKVACLLAHLSQVNGHCVLADQSVVERVRFTYHVHPVDLVHIPGHRTDDGDPRCFAVHAIGGRKELALAEWMYQLQEQRNAGWEQTFSRMAAAKTVQDAEAMLREYLTERPDDIWAQRLKLRLTGWRPGLGLPLSEAGDRMGDTESGQCDSPVVRPRRPLLAFRWFGQIRIVVRPLALR